MATIQNPRKWFFIVDSAIMDEAKALFQPLGLSVVRGHRFLGGFIGDTDSTSQFVEPKIKEWTASIITLSKAAEMYPQAAITTLSKAVCTLRLLLLPCHNPYNLSGNICKG